MSGSSICQSASATAADHQLALVQPSLPYCLGAWSLLQRQQQTHAATPAISGRHPTIVRSRISSASPLSAAGASQAVRPSCAVPIRAGGTASRASTIRRSTSSISPTKSRTALLEQLEPLAAGQESLEVLIPQRPDAKLDPALAVETARPDRRAAAERGMLPCPSRVCRAGWYRSSRRRRTPSAGPAP